MGTLVRTAAALGADWLALGPGSADAFHPRAVRAAMGATFALPLLEGVSPADLATREGFAVVAAVPRGGRAALGGRPDAAAWCWRSAPSGRASARRWRGSATGREVVRVDDPAGRAGAESLNVAAAGAALLAEAVRQRAAGAGDGVGYPPVPMSEPDLDRRSRSEALAAVAGAASLAELEAARVAHTGRRSRARRRSSPASAPCRPSGAATVGKAANAARRAVEAALAARTRGARGRGDGRRAGARHAPTSRCPATRTRSARSTRSPQVRQEMEDILLALGYRIADGPEVETEWHNFTALNTPAGHPARSPSDTFFIEGHPDRMLRTPDLAGAGARDAERRSRRST